MVLMSRSIVVVDGKLIKRRKKKNERKEEVEGLVN